MSLPAFASVSSPFSARKASLHEGPVPFQLYHESASRFVGRLCHDSARADGVSVGAAFRQTPCDALLASDSPHSQTPTTGVRP